MAPPLRVGVVTGILHPTFGGPYSVVAAQVAALRARGDVEVEVFGVAPADDLGAALADVPGAQVFPATWPRRWYRGAGLARALARRGPHIDVWHAHMLWDAPVLAAGRVAARLNRPLLVTPHGSVAAEWRNRSIHKRIYREAVLRPALGSRVALQALNAAEAAALEAWCHRRWPVVVIPNGLPAARFARPDPKPALERWPALRGRRVMLYLGRLWGEKGLDWLPELFAESGRPAGSGPGDDGWDLVIAGPDYRDYGAALAARVAALGPIARRIHRVGPVAGDLKWALLGLAELMVLPSKGEGFSMALLESMAAGTPAVFTDVCNQPDLAAAGGGLEVPRDFGAWRAVLRDLRSRSAAALGAMGAAAQAHGRSRYTAEGVAEALVSVYRRL